jgi:hypothetical protein
MHFHFNSIIVQVKLNYTIFLFLHTSISMAKPVTRTWATLFERLSENFWDLGATEEKKYKAYVVKSVGKTFQFLVALEITGKTRDKTYREENGIFARWGKARVHRNRNPKLWKRLISRSNSA